MKCKRALKEFQRYLSRCGDKGTPQTPRSGLARMCAFYREIRADDADLEADGDMLLFQWGTYDWGHGALFEVGIVRQLIQRGAEDDDIWQLDLTYLFNPSDALIALGEGNRWCACPADLPAFELFLMAHPAVEAVGSRDDGQAELLCDCAE